MTHVDVTVPDGLLAALRKAPHEVAAELRPAAAIHWYHRVPGASFRSAAAQEITKPPQPQSTPEQETGDVTQEK